MTGFVRLTHVADVLVVLSLLALCFHCFSSCRVSVSFMALSIFEGNSICVWLWCSGSLLIRLQMCNSCSTLDWIREKRAVLSHPWGWGAEGGWCPVRLISAWWRVSHLYPGPLLSDPNKHFGLLMRHTRYYYSFWSR